MRCCRLGAVGFDGAKLLVCNAGFNFMRDIRFFVFRDDNPRRVRQVALAVTSVTSVLQLQQQQRRGTLVLDHIAWTAARLCEN